MTGEILLGVIAIACWLIAIFLAVALCLLSAAGDLLARSFDTPLADELASFDAAGRLARDPDRVLRDVSNVVPLRRDRTDGAA